MRELRHRPAEGLVNRHLLGRVGEVVVTADDVGDAHQRIVHRDHVVVDRNPGRNATCATRSRTNKDGITDRLGGKLDLAAHHVVKAQRVVFNLQPDGEGLACGKILLNLRWRQTPAAAGVDLRAVFGLGLLPLGLQLRFRAETAVGLALGQQLLGVLGVNLQPRGLAVGAKFTLLRAVRLAGAFIPVQAEPAQVFNELRFVAGLGAFLVGVFNAQNERATGAAGEKPVVKRGAGIAHVEQACGRGSKANARSCSSHVYFDDRR